MTEKRQGPKAGVGLSIDVSSKREWIVLSKQV